MATWMLQGNAVDLRCLMPWYRSSSASVSAVAMAVGEWRKDKGVRSLNLAVAMAVRKWRKEKSSGSLSLGVPMHCTPLQQQSADTHHEESESTDVGILCEPCGGRGWLLCDFCEGQKTNVKAANNRLYRRCPSCRAVGYVLCPKCKVFKCVTFPDSSDGDLSTA